MRDLTATSHDGIELAVRDYGGAGPDVLLLHGATRNLEDWGAVLPYLRGLRVVSMDQRFHGLSGVAPPTTSADWVRDIETVIEALALSNPYLVGHSMGGVNALLFGVEHPECRGVLDIDGYDVRQPEFYDELPTDRVRDFLDGVEARSGSFVPLDDEGDDEWHEQQVAVFEQMDQAWGIEPAVTQAVVGRAFVKTADGRWARRPPGSFWGVAIADGATVDVIDLVRRASCPVTIVVCTKSVPVPPGRPAEFFAAGKRGVERHMRAIAAERPNVSAETIDATHGVIHERPEEVGKLILALVSA